MKKALLVFFTGMIVQFAGAQAITGAITSSDPIFNRPNEGAPPTTFSPFGIGVSYDLIPYTVTGAGLLTIVCNGSVNLDTYGFLYSPAGFDPLNPLTNVLVGDDDSGPGVNFAVTYNFPAAGTYYLVVTTFKPGGFGTYSILTTEGGPLPVSIVSFTAEKANAGKNLLKWTSAGEINIEKYQVQHSTDGSRFTDITGATIDAHNVPTTSYYNFADNSPFDKLNFYRLKIIERGNIITYSTVAVVNNNNNKGSGNITVFPNPAVNYLNIQTKAGQKGKAEVSITSALGQIVYKKDYSIVNESILYLDVQKLVAGNYYVRIKTLDGNTTTLPFVKH
jgi:hypothetical protein